MPRGGSFKARHANEDSYLEYLFAYIHFNPVEHVVPEWKEHGIDDMEKVKKYLEGYSFSSYPDYVTPSDRVEERILNRNVFPEYFSSFVDAREYHELWLKFKDDV